MKRYFGKRYFCEQCSGILPKGKIVCDKCGYENPELLPEFGERLKHQIIIQRITCIAAVIAVIVFLYANLLLPWQWGARRNRRVILDYVAEHYPNAKIISQTYNSARFFKWNNYRDGIDFKRDDLQFTVTAESGEILVDGFYEARVIDQFDELIQEKFLKSRGAEAYTYYRFSDNYYELYPYTGGLSVQLVVVDQGVNPQEVGWLYDFYSFWKEEGAFLTEYSVAIDIVVNKQKTYSVEYSSLYEFSNETEFYSAFKPE